MTGALRDVQARMVTDDDLMAERVQGREIKEAGERAIAEDVADLVGKAPHGGRILPDSGREPVAAAGALRSLHRRDGGSLASTGMKRLRTSLTWALLTLGTAPASASCGTAPSGERGDADARDADGPTCSSSVDDWCAQVRCLRTRAAAVDAASSPAPSYCPAVSIAACGVYDVVAWMFVDTSEWDYYEATTGDLVAVVTQGNNGDLLCAGPADFVQPTCASATVFPCASADAGTEAPLDAMPAGGDATP